MEKKQLFREAGIEPTGELIALVLGEANNAYVQFTDALKQHGIEVEWRYYKDAMAWLGKAVYKWTTKRGTKKEITASWVTIWEGFFQVGISMPERCRIDALNLPISNEVKQMIENARPLGKLKSISVGFDLYSDELFDDVFTLIAFRKKAGISILCGG